MGKDPKLLIVDDIETNRVLMEIIATSLNLKSDLAKSGHEAIEKFKQNNYDVIFLDCQMPLMNGFEVAKKIREIEIETHTIIIAVTAFVYTENKEKCLQAGMDDFLPKPLRKKNVKEILEKWLKLEDSDSKNTHPTDNFDYKIDKNKYPLFVEEQLTSAVKKNDIQKLLDLFKEATDEKIESLQEYLFDKDQHYISIVCTGLENNFKNVGASLLSKIANDIKIAANKKEIYKAKELFKILRQEYRYFLEITTQKYKM